MDPPTSIDSQGTSPGAPTSSPLVCIRPPGTSDGASLFSHLEGVPKIPSTDPHLVDSARPGSKVRKGSWKFDP